jgi:hypothetical protein
MCMKQVQDCVQWLLVASVIRSWYNRPICDRSTKGPSFTSFLKTKLKNVQVFFNLKTVGTEVGSEVLIAVIRKTSVFWDIMPFSSLKAN